MQSGVIQSAASVAAAAAAAAAEPPKPDLSKPVGVDPNAWRQQYEQQKTQMQDSMKMYAALLASSRHGVSVDRLLDSTRGGGERGERRRSRSRERERRRSRSRSRDRRRRSRSRSRDRRRDHRPRDADRRRERSRDRDRGRERRDGERDVRKEERPARETSAKKEDKGAAANGQVEIPEPGKQAVAAAEPVVAPAVLAPAPEALMDEWDRL